MTAEVLTGRRRWRVVKDGSYRSPGWPSGAGVGALFQLPRVGWVRVVADDDAAIEYEQVSLWERFVLWVSPS